MSPTSPPTPFSPSRTAQTPHSGLKSFFVENEKLRNLDNIQEEDAVKQSKKGATLVLDPAPLPRKSFSSQAAYSVPPPPSSLPRVPRIEMADTNENENLSPMPQEEPSRNGLDAPQRPLRAVSPPPPPPPLQRSDSPSFDEDFPLPPPPMLPSPEEDVSPSSNKKGKPEIHFPPPPSLPTNNSGGPPPPPPPPPLTENSTNF